MTFDELKAEKERYVKNQNESVAITFLGFMIKKCADPVELEKLRLEFADMLYKLERCGEAAMEYQLYAQLYSGSKNAAYADFQAIKALNCEVLSADRDQDRTQEVIDAAKKFAQKARVRGDYAKYLPGVEKLAVACEAKLCDAEVLHFYFNLNHGQFKAARARLDWIKDHYNACITEPAYLELEYRYASAIGDKKTAEQKLGILTKKFPKYTIARNKERSYAAWF
jgi:outer membrane protein assembly factor BamD (BamD/ComL family)